MANNHLLLTDITSYKINPFDVYPAKLETVGLTCGDLFAHLLCLRKALPHGSFGHLLDACKQGDQYIRTKHRRIHDQV